MRLSPDKKRVALLGMTLSPGTRLGPYEIVGAGGIGGMGEAFRAGGLRRAHARHGATGDQQNE